MCGSAQCLKSSRLHTKRHDMCSNTSMKNEPLRASLDCLHLFLHWHVGFARHTGTFSGHRDFLFSWYFFLGPGFTRWNPGPVLDSIHKFTETAQHAETILANPTCKPTRVKTWQVHISAYLWRGLTSAYRKHNATPGMLLSSSPIPEHDNTRCIQVSLDDQDFDWAMQCIDFELDFAADTPDEPSLQPTSGAQSQRCGSRHIRHAASPLLGWYYKCMSSSGLEPQIYRSAQHAATIIAFFVL